MMKKKIPTFNDSKRRRMTLLCGKKYLHYYGTSLKHDDDFYCLNCFHSCRTKNRLESYKKLCEEKDLCGAVMPSEKTKILEFNQYQKSVLEYLEK